jgi:hypothetical protein
MLPFYQCIIVLKQMLQLDDTSNLRVFERIIVDKSTRNSLTSKLVILLIKHCHLIDLLVHRHHELLQALEVKLELRNDVLATLFKALIEQLVSYKLYLVAKRLFRFHLDFFAGAVLSLDSLREHVLLQTDDIHHLAL